MPERSPQGLRKYLTLVHKKHGMVQIADVEDYFAHTTPSTDTKTEYQTWQFAFKWCDRKLQGANKELRTTEELVDSLRVFQGRVSAQMMDLVKPTPSTLSDSGSKELEDQTRTFEVENMAQYTWGSPATINYDRVGYVDALTIQRARIEANAKAP